MSNDENGEVDLSNFNLLASDAVITEEGVDVISEPTVFTSDPEKEDTKKEEKKVKDKRSTLEPALKVKTVESLEETLEEETTEEDEEEKEEVAKKSTSKKEETDDEDDDEQEEPGEELSAFQNFANFLHENGVADYDPEDFEDSEKGLLDMMDKTVSNAVDKYKKSVPNGAAAFLEYLEAGGDPKKYIENSSSVPDYKCLTDQLLEKDSVQKALVTDWMRLQGYSDEEISESLTDYEESGLLAKK